LILTFIKILIDVKERIFGDGINLLTTLKAKFVKDINEFSVQLIQENESNRSQCSQISAKTNSIAKKIDY